MNKENREILVESMRSDRNPNPNPPEHATRLLEETCARTGLDWKQRHCYLLNRGGKWGVTVSIDGFRLIANQDPEYGGQEGPFWCMGPEGPWTDIPPDKAPYASKVGVIRKGGGTTWGVAKYVDYNAKSPMWTKFASTMIAKCAEMLALRKALPGKLGGLYGVEEMDQAGGSSVAEAPKPVVDKSAQKSQSAQKAEKPYHGTVETTTLEYRPPPGSWEAQILACQNSDSLKALGAVISKSDLTGDEKLLLNKTYMAQKAELAKREQKEEQK